MSRQTSTRYIFRLAGQEDVYADISEDDAFQKHGIRISDPVQDRARDIVNYSWKLTTHRKNAIPVEVQVFKSTIAGGKPQESFVRTLKITPHFTPMTHAEYSEELDDLFSVEPTMVRNTILQYANDEWDCSYEEKLGHIRTLLIAMEPIIKTLRA